MTSPLFSKTIKHFNVLDSTNTEAENWLKEKKPDEGSAVLADFQTGGRGLGKNHWESAPYMNLLLSVILYPEFVKAEDQFMLNKIVSLSVKECVRNILDSNDVRIKWPNDIYVGERKISGILSRNSILGNHIMNTIAGIGININQTKFSANIPNPVSLKMITGNDFGIAEVLNELLKILEINYATLKKNKFAEIDKLYLDSLYLYNQQANYFANGKVFSGIITGVSNFGHLIVETNHGIREFDLKEIQFLNK
ncbi:MAG: biotin--[acetyl-CoA-carboxylase] ligase [Bacteroidales bacterium]|nr:biotin--[acetyl-CoA-carboxylase] ligase [Bacteroidales bacterium]